ncbi:MerR family transcriptional regulator [Nocardia thailandica]|uniref:MerR family transcriptional regulator n=1 Tax=Nocardia thailandica TaxID=257275 RepID=UPI0002F77B1D|nr:MerR family transcriptional regulator [Nocardia thailandica]
MIDSDLLTIGAFARACGLTATALRFYDDAGVLVPAAVDDATGYRYYDPAQIPVARMVRQLRAAGLPLADVTAVLAEPDPRAAADLIDTRLDAATRHLADLRAAARAAKSALLPDDSPSRPVAAAVSPAAPDPRPAPGEPAGEIRLGGPAFAAAVEQVLPATVVDPELPVLDAVRLEAAESALVLVATDRYRLTLRTVRIAAPAGVPWAVTATAGDLRALLSWVRRRPEITLRAAGEELAVGADGETRRCGAPGAAFPDHRVVLDGLGPVRTRAVLARADLLRVLDAHHDRVVRLRLRSGSGTVEVGTPGAEPARLAATTTGDDLTVHFDITVLHPAVTGGVGPDVMLEFTGRDLPARVRSADDGDLLTLAMPIDPEGPADRPGPR